MLSNPKSFPWGDCFFEYNWDNYVLEDLDGDGIKELIATCKSPERRDAGMQYYMIVGHNENGLVITQISDGVASAGGYRGEKYYIPGKGILYDRAVWAPNGDSSDKIFEFKNGLLEEKAYGRFDRNMDKPETGTWTWDEVLMSEEDYNKKLEAATENLSGKLLSEMPYKDKNSILKELDELMKRK